MYFAVTRGDARTIEKMITADGIDVNAVIVSIIQVIVTMNKYYVLHLQTVSVLVI